MPQDKPATTAEADAAKQAVGPDALTGTWRQCYWSIDNETGNELQFVAVCHIAGTLRDEKLWQDVAANGKNNTTLTINYKTGIGYDIDYWFIQYSFQDGNLWTGGGFVGQLQCNLTSSDEGGTGYIRFNGDGTVECVPPSSSNCSFNVTNQTTN